jgi:hypothetical protein
VCTTLNEERCLFSRLSEISILAPARINLLSAEDVHVAIFIKASDDGGMTQVVNYKATTIVLMAI